MAVTFMWTRSTRSGSMLKSMFPTEDSMLALWPALEFVAIEIVTLSKVEFPSRMLEGGKPRRHGNKHLYRIDPWEVEAGGGGWRIAEVAAAGSVCGSVEVTLELRFQDGENSVHSMRPKLRCSQHSVWHTALAEIEVAMARAARRLRFTDDTLVLREDHIKSADKIRRGVAGAIYSHFDAMRAKDDMLRAAERLASELRNEEMEDEE